MKETARKVTDHLRESRTTLISFEIIPPKRGGDIEDILDTVLRLKRYNPAFIDVTSHAAEIEYLENGGAIKKVVMRKRPGTLVVGSEIQRNEKYGTDVVLHVLCRGFTREETEDFLIDMSYARLPNVLAVRGDGGRCKVPTQERTVNTFAAELVRQIVAMNGGRYLNDMDGRPTDFCVGVAGYPDVHFESPNLETDIQQLKEKVEAGAEYIVTQMFFDNVKYFDFVERCRRAGLEVPIIPGLKILTRKEHLASLPRKFHVAIPYDLSREVMKAPDDEAVLEVGVEWALRQVEELIRRQVPALHFFIMKDDQAIHRVLQKAGF